MGIVDRAFAGAGSSRERTRTSTLRSSPVHRFMAWIKWIILPDSHELSALTVASVILLLSACGAEGPTESSQEAVKISVIPSEFELARVGDTVQLVAVATNAAGTVTPDTDFSWSSTDETVVVVTQEGLVTATGCTSLVFT